jgi:hypothetical protein
MKASLRECDYFKEMLKFTGTLALKSVFYGLKL